MAKSRLAEISVPLGQFRHLARPEQPTVGKLSQFRNGHLASAMLKHEKNMWALSENRVSQIIQIHWLIIILPSGYD